MGKICSPAAWRVVEEHEYGARGGIRVGVRGVDMSPGRKGVVGCM